MKIYNEITSRFNETTGKWETISEDSFEYGGQVAQLQGMNGNGNGAGGNGNGNGAGDTGLNIPPGQPGGQALGGTDAGMSLPANATRILTEDTITDTVKTTAGYFTNGDGTIEGSSIFTGSLGDSNEKYYFNVNQAVPTSTTSETQFAVTFGHIGGSGSDTFGDSTTNDHTLVGETEAVYRQLTSLLLTESEQSGGFKIASHGGFYGIGSTDNGTGAAVTAGTRDDYVWALIGKRNRFKDRFNKQAWTLKLSASKAAGTGGDDTVLTLCDDSKYVPSVTTPGGPRFNIVSGALGEPTGGDQTINYKHRTYGWFYPEMGVMLFSGKQLSSSLPGFAKGKQQSEYNAVNGAVAAAKQSTGFAIVETNVSSSKNMFYALRFVNSMQAMGAATTLRIRSEEDQTQFNYFCRIKAGQYNFSNNPTFTSGSTNKIRNATMVGNPTTFITGVGLYNGAGQLLATAKLSSPLKKNFVSEATIKVKLTY